MAVPFVDPKGNFGSLDDPPAAYRYTEARLTPAAMTMVQDLDEETVDFVANFDGERDEPICLPGALPNLLVNGASGIAVGMATNMPPHNLAEVAAAIEHVLTKRSSMTIPYEMLMNRAVARYGFGQEQKSKILLLDDRGSLLLSCLMPWARSVSRQKFGN